jgi:hypothetical protein
LDQAEREQQDEYERREVAASSVGDEEDMDVEVDRRPNDSKCEYTFTAFTY